MCIRDRQGPDCQTSVRPSALSELTWCITVASVCMRRLRLRSNGDLIPRTLIPTLSVSVSLRSCLLLGCRPTKRASDVWDSATFSSIFLASGFSCSQTLSTPAHTQVTQTVGPQGMPTAQHIAAASGVSYDMNANAFRHFYGYHFAENHKLWDTRITPLSHEQFTQPAGYSHGSVRDQIVHLMSVCLLYTSPSPRDRTRSRMPSSA